MSLNANYSTGVEDSLCNKIGHYLRDRSIVLSAAIQNIFDDFVELLHKYYNLSFNFLILYSGLSHLILIVRLISLSGQPNNMFALIL